MNSLGQRIREERRRQNLTLNQVCNSAKLSKSFLSQIERDLSQPSVSTIKKIAHELGIIVVSLFVDEATNHNNLGHPPHFKNGANGKPTYVNDVKVIRAGHRKSLKFPQSTVSYELITPDLNRQVEILYLRLKPGDSSGEVIDPPGEKCFLILKGTLEYRVCEEVHLLQVGDSIYHASHLPASWRGVGNTSIEVLAVITPPWF